MKTLKYLMAAVVAMGCISIANADTTVYLTGSTAYRGNTHTAITKIFDAGSLQYGYVGSSLGGASQAIFKGTVGNQPTTVKTAWSGSEGGLQTVAGQVQIAFLPDATTVAAGGTGGATAATPSNGGDVHVPDVAMSDTFQSSSAYFNLYKGTTYPTLTESPNSPVGVVPFKFVASKGAPAGLMNITGQQAKVLYNAGTVPLAFFTNDPADQGNTVVATGRDPDSGTRLTTLAEIGLGAQASIKQYQPQSGGNPVTAPGATIDKFVPWPASKINGIDVAVFNGGYSSGGQLAGAAASTTPANFTLVTYLGVNDADNTALKNGAVELSYNGVLLGPAAGTPASYNNNTALTEGKYTFWGYEHMYYRASTASVVKTVADAIAGDLKTADAQVLLGSMKVQRTTDGAVVLPTYNTNLPPQ